MKHKLYASPTSGLRLAGWLLALSLLVAYALRPVPASQPGPAPVGPYRPLASNAVVPTRAKLRAAVPADTSAAGLAGVLADVRRRSFFLVADQQKAALTADNYAQRLTARFAPATYTVAAQPRSGRPTPAWQVSWQLRGIGRKGHLALRPAAATPTTTEAHARYAQRGFTIDFDNTPAGVRQTYRVAERPAGTGPVEVQLAVATTLLARQTSPAEIAFAEAGAPNAPVLIYNSLKAWDAAGHVLPAHLRLAAGGQHLALVVDDAGARYPLTIDPLASTAGTTLTGTTAGDSYATSVAQVGDLNGDGYGEVAVGAPNANNGSGPNSGAVYVYLGSSTGLATTPAQTLAYGSAGSHYGLSVAGGGDYNGDGYADLVTGDPGYNGNQGRCIILLGSPGGFSSALIVNNSFDGQLGTTVAGLGDVNGDGYDDLGAGAPYYAGSSGTFYIIYGAASNFGAINGYAGTTGQYLASSVASAGDVNADGYADFLVGAPSTGNSAGLVQVYLGGSGGIASSFVLTRNTASDLFGDSVAGVGDVDGDGYSDFLIGAPGVTSAAGNTSATGAAYYYRGGTSLSASTPPTTTLTGATAGDNFGSSVAGAGDVNNDGYADFAVGAPGYNNSTGRVYYYGGTGTAGTFATPQTLDGQAVGNQFGSSLSGGDANGDGYGDLVVGAPAYGSNAGRSYVYYGSPALLAATPATTLNGEATTNYFGYSVAGVGDVTGDGYADIVIGAYGNSSSKGKVYLYAGRAMGLSTTPTTLVGESNGDYFGYSVAGAGDVNGDGYADVLIGAPHNGNNNKGKTYLYLGGSTGLSATAASTVTGESANNYFGSSVAGAGDVNADGYADVLVGAYNNSGGKGKAYLYYGGSAGLSTTLTATALVGESNGDNFGYSVAGAGDIDGDGFADVVIGAPLFSNSLGRAYVYHGAASGLRAVTPDTYTGTTAAGNFGYSVAGAGDVNGDGFFDVVMGAPATSTSPGRASVYYGSSTGLSASPTALTGAANGDKFGTSVAQAGDVNGDGYADVVVGANGSSSSTGKAYVYYGTSVGLGASSPDIRGGLSTGDNFGFSVAGGGDVNGDGFADVLVGAYGNTTGTGRTSVYYGSSALQRPARLRLLNTDLSTPLNASNLLAPQFGIGLLARPVTGRVRARVVWEAVANGKSFSHSSLLATSTAYTGRGTWTDLPATSATELTALVSKAGRYGRYTRVRARLEYASSPLSSSPPANGTGGVGARVRYGPWQYVNAGFVAGTNLAAPLPVALTAFTATLVENPAAVHLAWATASEQNSARFEVERSLDGSTFAQMGGVAAAGSTATAHTYALTDKQLPAGASQLYYRLRQVDLDGTAHYSPVRTVALTSVPAGLALFPNPASGSATLTGTAAGATVQVLDALGRLVLTTAADASGTAHLDLPSGLPAGIYLVRSAGRTARLALK